MKSNPYRTSGGKCDSETLRSRGVALGNFQHPKQGDLK